MAEKIFCEEWLKTKKIQTVSLKMLAVAHKKWLLTRGSNYSDMSVKTLVFCERGRLREVVAKGGLTVFKQAAIVKTSSWLKIQTPQDRRERTFGRGSLRKQLAQQQTTTTRVSLHLLTGKSS